MIDLSPYSFKAIIFDCDGTIANTMPLHYRSWIHAFEANSAKFPFSKEEFESMAGIGLHDTVDYLNRKYADRLDPDTVVNAKEGYYEAHLHEIGPIEEVVSVIEAYHGKYPMAVASGGYRQTVIATLDNLNLADRFDAIVTQEDVTRSKPAPDIFLKAAEKLIMPPADCIVFEDSNLGIQGATDAGMASIKIESRL